MPTDSRRLCDCDACTGDGEDPPCLVSKRTWFRHQANKRRRLTGESVSGGGSAGPTGSNTDTDGDEPLADLATGSGGGGGGETAGADCPPGPDHTADGGAAACSEDSSLRPPLLSWRSLPTKPVLLRS